MLSLSSSTLSCRAAEAFWYSSNKWYAAKDDAKEKPKRNPTILGENRCYSNRMHFDTNAEPHTPHEIHQLAFSASRLFQHSIQKSSQPLLFALTRSSGFLERGGPFEQQRTDEDKTPWRLALSNWKAFRTCRDAQRLLVFR